MALLTMHKWHRHVLAIFYFLAAFSAYFADSYGVIIDKDMLINAAETNIAEALGLFDYMRKSHSNAYVLSLSGGADSTACACLIKFMHDFIK